MVLMRGSQQKLLLALGLFIEELVAFHQNDYNLTSERMEILEYNKKLVVMNTKNFKYNRTHAVINLTLSVNCPSFSPRVMVQAYKFSSNEYRLFPLSFSEDACDAFHKDDFGAQSLSFCGNFTCPIVKGYYEICNWIPDESKFPPYIPSGRYMFEVKLMQGSEQAVVLAWYIKIEKKFHYV